MTGKWVKWVWMRASLILVLAISGATGVAWAQAPSLPAASAVVAHPVDPPDADLSSVRLLVGRSTVLNVPGPVARVSVTSADVADVLVTSPSQLLVNGKLPGTISMFVWDRAGGLRRYEVVVQRDLARLDEQMRQLFPVEHIGVQSNGKNIVLTGIVSNKDVIEKAVDVAAGYVDKREEVVPLLQLQPGAPTNQVLLRVRFAEVTRNALQSLGASYFTGPNGYNNQYVGRVGTEQFGNDLPQFNNDDPTHPKLVFSDFLNLFLFDTKNQLGAVVKALQNKGLFQSLAEPNLVAESGKEASFLAGGEFPIPVAQGSGANLAISVVFKEFGIRLNFTPTVNGDRVHLKVRPEVSSLDFGNAIVLNGFRIPALTTRRTETELELQNNQTFAIAGLMNNTTTKTLQKMPGIGDIPILGLFFKSQAAEKDQTELVVMITPEILPNNSPGAAPSLPRTPEQYLPPLPTNGTVPPPPPAFGMDRQAAAAAAVSALTPSGPTFVNPPGRPGPAGPPAQAENAPPRAAGQSLTPDEQKTFDRARRQEEQKAKELAQADERANKAEAKRDEAAAAAAARTAAKEHEKEAKAAREQAKRDAELTKRKPQ